MCLKGALQEMITVRQAVPEDAEYVARIMDLAGRQHLVLPSFEGEQREPGWATMFPGSEEERLDKIGWLFLNAEELIPHYSRCKVADIDGVIAGGLTTHTEEHDKLLSWVRAGREMGLSYPEIIGVYWRMLPYFKVHPPILKDTLVIEYVATFPEYQRRGVITALLEYAMEQARDEGFPRMQVTTLIGNISALKAYEKVGFRVDTERTNRSHEKRYGSPGQVRLILEL